MKLTAHGAQLNLPAYGTGTLDGAARAEPQRPRATALLSGKVATFQRHDSFLRISRRDADSAQTMTLPPLDLDVAMASGRTYACAARDLAPGSDIGATGSAPVGRYARRADDGRDILGDERDADVLRSRVPRAERARRASARRTASSRRSMRPATTHVTNPDPNSPYSGVDVTVAVDGPVTNPQITF